MGSENLFHRRKGINKTSLQRKGATKNPTPLYLIVCEGEKTEPQYFVELRNHERISSITIKVCGECDSAPISVVEYAVSLYKQLQSEGTFIEKVYCVFDKDNHESFYRACAAIDNYAKNNIPIETIKSTPCFEYWLLLHYDYHRAPYQSKGNGSVANQVLRDLNSHLKKYKKGSSGLYELLKERQQDAITHARRAQVDALDTGQDNPSTQVHILVEELLKYAAT